jgi:GT2 family glycosyltransferase
MDETQAPAVPKISVIILSYNSAPALRRCLTALEASTSRKQMEVIVVDAGSQDESPRLDTEFPEVTFQRMPRHFGATKALNIGGRTAAGEYIFYVSTQTEVQADTAAKLAQHLDEDESAAAVCPALIAPHGEPANQIRRLPTPDTLSQAWRDPESLPAIAAPAGTEPVSVEYPGRAALMVRKFYLRGINYLDEKYGQFWSDADLCFQIRRAGRKILLLPDVKAILHPSEDGELSSGARALLEADSASGAARYASKYFGAFAGVKLRIGAVLYGLGQLFTFRDLGFQIARLSGLLSGQKVDGTQTTL